MVRDHSFRGKRGPCSGRLAENIEQLVSGRPDAVWIAAEAGQRRDAMLQIQLVDDPRAPLRSSR